MDEKIKLEEEIKLIEIYIEVTEKEIKGLKKRIEKITEDINNYNNGSLYYEFQQEAELFQLYLEDEYDDLRRYDSKLIELKEALKKA